MERELIQSVRVAAAAGWACSVGPLPCSLLQPFPGHGVARLANDIKQDWQQVSAEKSRVFGPSDSWGMKARSCFGQRCHLWQPGR